MSADRTVALVCQRRRDIAAVCRRESAAMIEVRRPPIGGLLTSCVLFLRGYLLGLFFFGSLCPALALREAVAVTVHFENVDMVCEAVE